MLREELDSWALLFNPANGGVVGISPVGVALWQLLDHHNTASGMACALRERCDDVPADATPARRTRNQRNGQVRIAST